MFRKKGLRLSLFDTYYFPPEAKKRRPNDLARDLLYLIDIFSDDSAVKDLHSYKHLKRLFNEQCEAVAYFSRNGLQGCMRDPTQ
ncbi:MAG: hypothetical protein FD151_962 [bacterium]|nr:MAG: hypothetical protein FD151_962 [bacterium]